MKELRYTLVSDGSSDKALIPILNWLLREHNITCPIQAEWADLRRLHQHLQKLSDRIGWSLELFPCDLLFVHRDAEKESIEVREKEILQAVKELPVDRQWSQDYTICVVPVRMSEAWLLLDEIALRRAAGNPQGRESLQLPMVKNLEQLSDPKRELYDLLRRASGLTGRRLAQFSVPQVVHRLADSISDFSPLRTLSAFSILEKRIASVVKKHRWI